MTNSQNTPVICALATPSQKKVVQIGHWIRKLHSIYFLPTILKRCAAHQHFDFVRKIFETEKAIYNFQVCVGLIQSPKKVVKVSC